MAKKKDVQLPSPLKLPLTVAQAAKLWDMNEARVKKLVDQGRVKHSKVGGSKNRAGMILIEQLERPALIEPTHRRKAANA